MKNASKKMTKRNPISTEVVSARLSRAEIMALRRLYPGSSNQTIIEKLVEEKIARKNFANWLEKLTEAASAGGLDLDRI